MLRMMRTLESMQKHICKPQTINEKFHRKKESPPLAGPSVMNVISVAAECAPWSKTGGLGDVGALPKALAQRGHRVMVVSPRYGNYPEPKVIGNLKRYKVDGQDMEVKYYHSYFDSVDFVFMDSPIFRHIRNDIYGGNRVGRCPLDDFSYVDLPHHYIDLFRLDDPVGGEHFNIFAAGLRALDRVVTVSHGYAWVLKTPEGGWVLQYCTRSSTKAIGNSMVL